MCLRMIDSESDQRTKIYLLYYFIYGLLLLFDRFVRKPVCQNCIFVIVKQISAVALLAKTGKQRNKSASREMFDVSRQKSFVVVYLFVLDIFRI